MMLAMLSGEILFCFLSVWIFAECFEAKLSWAVENKKAIMKANEMLLIIFINFTTINEVSNDFYKPDTIF